MIPLPRLRIRRTRNRPVYLAVVCFAIAAVFVCNCFRRAKSVKTVLIANGFSVVEQRQRWNVYGVRIDDPIPSYRVHSTEGSNLNEVVIQAFSNGRSRIIELDLSCRTYMEESLPIVSKMLSLESLTLSNVDSVWPQAVSLHNLHHLSTLTVRGRGFTDRQAKELDVLIDLKFLNLSETMITNQTVVCLSSLPFLQDLKIGSTLVDDACYAELKSGADDNAFRNLRSIYLGNTRIGDSVSDLLPLFPNISRIDLSRTQVTDSGIRRVLSECHELSSIVLDGCELDGELWCDVPWCSSIQFVSMQNTSVRGETIVRMCEAHPSVLCVFYFGCEVSQSDGQRIADILANRQGADDDANECDLLIAH